jgi:hypothetical protein
MKRRKALMKDFNADDVEKAHNELRPIAQKLVDRFGQARTFGILTAVAHAVCPNPRGPPRYMRVAKDEPMDG